MALTKEKKQKIIKDLKEKITKQKVIIFVDFKGLKVRDLFDLRKKLKKVDSQFLVAKKTLMGIVFKEKKMEIGSEKFEGQPAIIFGFQNEMSPLKAAFQFSQENKNLKILGGYFEGKFREAIDIITLAQLPSREELLARLIGGISAPISSFINVLQGNIKGLIYALSAIKK